MDHRELLMKVLSNGYQKDTDQGYSCAGDSEREYRPMKKRMAGEAIQRLMAERDMVSAGEDARINSPGKEDDRNVVIHNYSDSPVIIQSKGSSCDFR